MSHDYIKLLSFLHMSKEKALICMMLLLWVGFPWCLRNTLNLTDIVTKVDFAIDGTYLAVTSTSANAVYVYDTINYFKVFTYVPTSGTVMVARFCRNNSILAVGRSDGQVVLLNGKPPFSSTVLDQFQPDDNDDIIVDMDFSYGGDKLLVCFTNDNDPEVIKDWGDPTLRDQSLQKSTGHTIACQWSMNDDIVIVTDSSEVEVYNVPPTGSISSMRTRITAGSNFLDVSVRPDNSATKIIVAGGNNGQVDSSYFYNTNTGSTISSTSHSFIDPFTQKVRTVCYSGNALYYAVGGDDKKIWIVDDATDSQIFLLTESTNSIYDCDFSTDGNLLAAGTSASSGQSFVYIYSKTCSFCSPGFYTDGFVSCAPCDQVITSCSMCYNSSYCVSCSRGYYLSSWTSCTSCFQTMDGCSTCINGTSCIECNQGYYKNAGGFCQSCGSLHDGCLACNLTDCYACQWDYHLSGSNCVLCSNTIDNCLRCNASNYCLQCAIGYYSAGATCQPCDVKCMRCNVTSTNCTVCSRGYQLVGYTCTPCGINCLACSSGLCLDCSTGHYVSNGSCLTCSQPCATCNLTDIDCLSCTSGFYLDNSTCELCINNCSLCRSATNCTACNIGFYLTASDTCLSCGQLYPSCEHCDSSACFTCDQGSYLASATSCDVCENSMTGCQSCTSGSQCSRCGVGYYRTGANGTGACSFCPEQCGTCSSSSTCLSCSSGYYLDNVTCISCSSPCLTCNESATCLSCLPGYYYTNSSMSNNTCIPCTNITGCVNCLDSLTCRDCTTGFFLSNGTCFPCGNNCADCNQTDCHSCQLGYYTISANVCSLCSGNCTACSNSGDCLMCPLGYYLNTSPSPDECHVCSALDSNCLNCNSTTCLICLTGYYVAASNLCQLCNLNISDCLACSSALVCTQCLNGYYLVNDTCTSCASIAGCQSCSNSSVCTLCASGFYNNGGVCVVCSQGCVICTDGSSCTICDSMSYMVNGSCLSCKQSLIGCTSCIDSGICLACGGGYLLNGSLCEPCSLSLPACSLCDGLGTCLSCQQGYYLSNSSTCLLCSSSSSLAGCLLCESSTNCLSCSNGYYLSGGNCWLCSGVVTGCQQCSNDGSSCLACASGYAQVNGTCQLCSTNQVGCIFCSSQTQCSQCQGGYYLETNNTCSPCGEPECEICHSSSPLLCVTCNSGYYLASNSSCLTCPQTGCLDCNGTECLSCQIGYHLNSGTCSLCSVSIPGCSKCLSSSNCQQCQSLFYLQANTCLSCSSSIVGCSFCSDNATCLACDGGYYLNNSICEPCSNIEGCLICEGGTQCLSCTAGYFEVNNTCALCLNQISNCFQCDNSTNCSACQSGYKLTEIGECEEVEVTASGPTISAPAKLIFKSHYVNISTLRHSLAVSDKSSTFENVDSVNWTTEATINLQTTDGQILLTIISVQLSVDKATLYFYTDNPTSISTSQLPIANKGRILAGKSMTQLNMQASLSLPKSVINNVLPSVLVTSDLKMNYDMSDSTFYVTYVKESFSLYFFLFGTIVVIFCFLYGIIRVCFGFYSRNSELIGHAFALKTISLVVFPTYAQYVNFCLGFMVVDLPWLNNLLPSTVANEFDIAPMGYFFYFQNMNLASMHLITTLIVVLILVTVYCALKEPKSQELSISTEIRVKNLKFKAVKEFVLNFFCFGMVFAGFSSIIGAFLNGSYMLTLNAIFYIAGIVLFGAIFSEAMSCLVFNHRLCRLRIALKAVLLAGAGLNPLYLAAVAMIVDLILLIIEYKIRKRSLISPIAWLFSQLCMQGALVSLYFIPDSFLTLGVVMALVIISFIFEGYQLYHEWGLGVTRHTRMFEEEQADVRSGIFIKVNESSMSLSTVTQKEESPPKLGSSDQDKDNSEELVQSSLGHPKLDKMQSFESRKFDNDNIQNVESLSTTKVAVSPLDAKRRKRKFRAPKTPAVEMGLTLSLEDQFTLE